jgi:hypothetical protein
MGTQNNVVVGLGDGQIKIGTYGAVEGSADDLGYTIGGVELTVAREYYEKRVDQELGTIELIKTNEKTTLKFKLAEVTLANLAKAMDYPSSAIAGSTLSFGGNADVNELTIYLNVKAPGGGSNRKYTFNKAVCISAAAHSYKKDAATEIECEFQILQDTSKTADQQVGSIVDTGADSTPPTVALTTPVDGATVTQGTTNPVVWTITEANTIDESSIVYGDNDGGTFMIIDDTVIGSAAIKAGTIVYSAALKTVTFTPTVAWTTAHTFQAIVTTGLKDTGGNHLAAIKIEQFSAS